MSNHARIEEVSDSDPDEVDLSALATGPNTAIATGDGSLISPADIPASSHQPIRLPGAAPLRLDRERMKDWHMVYPVYLDATRTRSQGRIVHKDHAVENPLAREICDAVGVLGMQYAFEAAKTHPRDWANPGRVRVRVKGADQCNNKHDLLNKIGDYLRAHPATPETPLKLKIHGMPPDMKAPPAPAVPRGWKMGSILPLHSDAVSGGGVSENFFQDIQREMQGLGPAAAGMLGGGGGGGAGSASVSSGEGRKKAKGKKG